MFCCSSVSDVGLVVVAFEAAGCCISMGDVGVGLFAVSWGVVWYQMVYTLELMDGMVKLPFGFYPCICILQVYKGTACDLKVHHPLCVISN